MSTGELQVVLFNCDSVVGQSSPQAMGVVCEAKAFVFSRCFSAIFPSGCKRLFGAGSVLFEVKLLFVFVFDLLLKLLG